MEPIFKLTGEQQRRVRAFSNRVKAFCDALKPYADELDVEAFEAFRERFELRSASFFQEHKRFCLAVAGQVKAGKSTFLNALLFDGRPLLPCARTPKTAALTRIEYAQNASLTVRFLSREDWESLTRLSEAGGDLPLARAARETVELARLCRTPLEECFEAGTSGFPLEGRDDLAALLNDYVGEDGRYTPVVADLTLGLPLDRLRELTVFDTPGLNDPVLSRVERTRRCLEICDAVFFLSRSGRFLDRDDLALLTSQLPQKGVASLTLVASQFDSALLDTLPCYPDLARAIDHTREDLRRHARESVDTALREMERAGFPAPVLAAVERCRDPLFLSAAAEGIAQNSPASPGGQQALLAELLGSPDAETLRAIGNIGAAREAFDRLATQKDRLLLERAQSLAAAAQNELGTLCSRARAGAVARREAYMERAAALASRQKELSALLNQVRKDVDEAFEEYLAPLEQTLLTALGSLEHLLLEWAEPESRVGIEVHSQMHSESVAKLLRPWTWGRRRTVYSTGQTHYSYLDPADAQRNLERLALFTARLQASAFLAFSDTSRLQNRLYEVAGKNFPSHDPVRQPDRLRGFVASSISRLPAFGRLPPDRLSVAGRLPGQGPVRDPAAQKALLDASQTRARQIVEERRQSVERFANRLREQAASAAAAFTAALCEALLSERSELQKQTVELERACSRLQELAELLGRTV